MKQKYELLRDDEKKLLILREHAELDKDMMSLLCEQTYPLEDVEEAIKKGPLALVNVLRTKNMYPPGYYIERIAASFVEIAGQSDKTSAEMLFDDLEFLTREEQETDVLTNIMEDEASDLDDLLDDEDSMDDDFEDDDISNIGSNSSLKIADDDSLDIDDEV